MVYLVTLVVDLTVRMDADSESEAERGAHDLIADSLADATKHARVNHIIRVTDIIGESTGDGESRR